jgi:GSH-dependent disulfide-bond oxidoreductase
MIDLYAWGTTNGRRALIMAEEAGLPFNLRQINIQKGDQKTPEYEKINPYRKIPALVDPEGPGGQAATLFESVAICFYLAEKTGKFLGTTADRPNVLKWSMFHATNVLCTVGSLGRINDPSFESGAKSQLDTMNEHLSGRDWFAEAYSIADIIPFTRINGIKHETVKVADYGAEVRLSPSQTR